jgi:hypothetical protein
VKVGIDDECLLVRESAASVEEAEWEAAFDTVAPQAEDAPAAAAEEEGRPLALPVLDRLQP